MPGVNRHRLTILLPLAAVLIAGCSGFSDNDAVARVDDAELTSSQLSELVEVLTQADPSDGEASRSAIGQWVQIEAVKTRLEQSNITLTEEEIDEATEQMSSVVPDFATRSDFLRDFLVAAQASFNALGEADPVTDEEVREFYERGIVESGVACTAHILVETETEAEEILAELDGGALFADLAAERSLDPGSGAQGGILQCTTTEQFRTTYVPPFVDAALAAEVGVPTAPVESDFGYHIIVVRPLDEVRAELDPFFASADFAINLTIEQLDVYVDPRYGTIEAGVVVPLT